MKRPVGLLGIALLICTLSAAFAQGAKHVTVPGGATTNAPAKQLSFTQAQVTMGKGAYLANCAYCHNADLSGLNGPALSGHDTNVSWQSGGGLWAYTTEQMPVGNAGGLRQQDYVNIVAYILAQNGQHPGQRAMTAKDVAADTNRVGGTAR